jgi:hypothetical protein
MAGRRKPPRAVANALPEFCNANDHQPENKGDAQEAQYREQRA